MTSITLDELLSLLWFGDGKTPSGLIYNSSVEHFARLQAAIDYYLGTGELVLGAHGLERSRDHARS